MNMFYQPDLERMLVRRLERLPNVQIRRGWELVELDPDAEHPRLRFAPTAGETAGEQDPIWVSSRYAIGADGARSKVRDLLGISQTDLGFAYDWLVVDVLPNQERVWKPYVVQHCNPERPTTLVGSGPGRRRWEFMRMPGETIDELNTTEKAWELLAASDITPENATLERHAVYTFRGAWADQWARGRILLAGDAAHLMPPFLGQGLCSGMRDAAALSWRLDLVLREDAPPALLDAYGPERSEHVQEIVRQAVEIGRVICMLEPADVEARDRGMMAAMMDPSLALRPPPEPRLGQSGQFNADDPKSGYLSFQGRVIHQGREGFFDDVVGKGWQLLLNTDAVAPAFGAPASDLIARLGISLARFGAAGDTIDLDGTYGAWFKRLGADAILVRPDLYVFGAGPLEAADTLVTSAWRALHDASTTDDQVATRHAASLSRIGAPEEA